MANKQKPSKRLSYGIQTPNIPPAFLVESETPPSAHGTQSIYVAEQLGFKDELALLVLLRVLIRFVIFPANRLLALLAADVSYDMSARGHVPVTSFACNDIDHTVEEESLAMLASEVLYMAVSICNVRYVHRVTHPAYDLVMIRQMRLAGLAAVDAFGI